MVSSLIAGGAQVEQACLKKWTAMHEASRTGFVPVMELLMQNGGQVSETDQHGGTPLGIAAEYGHAEVLELLIKHGDSTWPLVMNTAALLSTKQQREMSWSGTPIISSNKKIDFSGVGGGNQTKASKTQKDGRPR